MENLPIFTTSNPALSRWQSLIEQYLKDENPNLTISEIRNLPMSQGCWKFVKMKLEGKKTVVPTASFSVENVDYQAYANEYFFDAVQEYLRTKNIVNFNTSIDAWDYSTAKGWDWFRTTGFQYVTNWLPYLDGLTNIYRDYKDNKFGNGDINYGVIDWKLPKNAKIAVIGDWGTENHDAKEFLRALIKDGVDCIIHLGDVYYSGSKSEYEDKFIKIIRKINPTVPVFGIPGNHEYYSQGEGFYHMIDVINNGIPDTNQAASYFCLKTEDDTYQFVGLDTGINDGNPASTLSGAIEGPDLKSQNDFDWAINKIEKFSGKTIMLSHHQLFSHVGGLNSKQYGNNCINPYLYKQFAPYFKNKIAAWYWGHEHSLALYNEGAFGLNQGRLIGSSSYEQAKADAPYANNYPLVPYSTINKKLATNEHYKNDKDAEFYYPHAGAIITLREKNNPIIDYYSYPSWKNGHAPKNPALKKEISEIITNPTYTPNGIWESNKKIKEDKMKSDKAPAICIIENSLFMVYKNTEDINHLWFAKSIKNENGDFKSYKPQKFPTPDDVNTPSTNFNPVMVQWGDFLYLFYTDSHSNNIYWCFFDIKNEIWYKTGELLIDGKPLQTTNSPTVIMHNNRLHLFFLDNNETSVNCAVWSNNVWSLSQIKNNINEPIVVYNKSCPAVVSVLIDSKPNLFMICNQDNKTKRLSLLRYNEVKNVWNSLGNLTKKGTSENFIQTSQNVAVTTDGKFLKILYVTDKKSVNFATMDLGYYDFRDQFIYYDFEDEKDEKDEKNRKKGIWSGGIPVLCKTDATMQTQDFPAYFSGDQLDIIVYPGQSDTTMWCSVQKL